MNLKTIKIYKIYILFFSQIQRDRVFCSVGSSTLNEGQRFQISDVFINPFYIQGHRQHDIAVVKFQKSLVFDNRVNAIYLPWKDQHFADGTECKFNPFPSANIDIVVVVVAVC